MARNEAARLAGVCAGLIAGAALAQGDAQRGAALYAARCGACHSLDEHGPGPRHRGLIGRRAGGEPGEPGYDYSPALRASKVVWTKATLDRWLANPSAFIPGNKMVVQLANDPGERADLIAWLTTATAMSRIPSGVD
jgi:cytochrome c